MKTLTILESFDGYPDGAVEGSRRVSFAEGREVEADDAFADLITGKGLAREAAATSTPESTPKPAAAPPAPEKETTP